MSLKKLPVQYIVKHNTVTHDWQLFLDGLQKENKNSIGHIPVSTGVICHFTESLSDQANFTDSMLGSHHYISSCNYVDFPHYPVKTNKKQTNKTS